MLVMNRMRTKRRRQTAPWLLILFTFHFNFLVMGSSLLLCISFSLSPTIPLSISVSMSLLCMCWIPFIEDEKDAIGFNFLTSWTHTWRECHRREEGLVFSIWLANTVVTRWATEISMVVLSSTNLHQLKDSNDCIIIRGVKKVGWPDSARKELGWPDPPFLAGIG